jgi:hypothetical protein
MSVLNKVTGTLAMTVAFAGAGAAVSAESSPAEERNARVMECAASLGATAVLSTELPQLCTGFVDEGIAQVDTLDGDKVYALPSAEIFVAQQVVEIPPQREILVNSALFTGLYGTALAGAGIIVHTPPRRYRD